MKKSKFKFNTSEHPTLSGAPREVVALLEERSIEDLAEISMQSLVQITSLTLRLNNAETRLIQYQGSVSGMEFELASLKEMFEEREEELSKLSGASLINCKCQVVMPHDCKLKS